jgi:hypothetical protein
MPAKAQIRLRGNANCDRLTAKVVRHLNQGLANFGAGQGGRAALDE